MNIYGMPKLASLEQELESVRKVYSDKDIAPAEQPKIEYPTVVAINALFEACEAHGLNEHHLGQLELAISDLQKVYDKLESLNCRKGLNKKVTESQSFNRLSIHFRGSYDDVVNQIVDKYVEAIMNTYKDNDSRDWLCGFLGNIKQTDKQEIQGNIFNLVPVPTNRIHLPLMSAGLFVVINDDNKSYLAVPAKVFGDVTCKDNGKRLSEIRGRAIEICQMRKGRDESLARKIVNVLYERVNKEQRARK